MLPVPRLVGKLEGGALGIYNLNDHLSPREVYDSIISPYFGHLAGPNTASSIRFWM